MKINLAFLGLFIATLVLMVAGYFILNPKEIGVCLEVQYNVDCYSDNFYFGIGKTFYSSLNAFALLFIILTLVPNLYLRYWYRIVLPLGLLGISLIIVSPPVPVNMFDSPRSDVAKSVGVYLLLLTLAVVGYSIFKDIFSNKKSRG